MRNIGELVLELAKQDSGAEALVQDRQRLGAGEVYDRAAACAQGLDDAGVRPGDRVAVLLPNGWRYAVAYLGIQLAGAVAVLVNSRFEAAEIAHVLTDSGAEVVISEGELAARLPLTARLLAASELISDAGPGAGAGQPPGLLRQPSDVANLLYTSGTSGRPKGAMQTHRNLLANARTVRERIGAGPGDRTLIVAPLFHATGVNSQLIGFLSGGACCVIAPQFKASDVLETIRDERITVFAGVAAMLQLMMRDPSFDPAVLSTLRLFVMGGSPVPEAVVAEASARMPDVMLANVWGLTEATSIVTYVEGRDYLERPWSAGRAVPGVSLGVAAPDGVIGTEPDVVGELCVAGPTVAAGYWNNGPGTAEAFRDGWLHTGDIGRLDRDGYVQVLDRLKDMIIRGGENVYCLEVENALATHPAVAEVAVVGAPDEIMGERVRAVVAVRPGETVSAGEVRAWAAGLLADYKVPAEVDFVPALPRNPAGKVLKRRL